MFRDPDQPLSMRVRWRLVKPIGRPNFGACGRLPRVHIIHLDELVVLEMVVVPTKAKALAPVAESSFFLRAFNSCPLAVKDVATDAAVISCEEGILKVKGIDVAIGRAADHRSQRSSASNCGDAHHLFRSASTRPTPVKAGAVGIITETLLVLHLLHIVPEHRAQVIRQSRTLR